MKNKYVLFGSQYGQEDFWYEEIIYAGSKKKAMEIMDNYSNGYEYRNLYIEVFTQDEFEEYGLGEDLSL